MQKVIFLFDINNTLLDNDRVERDIRRYLEDEFGAGAHSGRYALDPALAAAHPPADIAIERIGDLMGFDIESLVSALPEAGVGGGQ